MKFLSRSKLLFTWLILAVAIVLALSPLQAQAAPAIGKKWPTAPFGIPSQGYVGLMYHSPTFYGKHLGVDICTTQNCPKERFAVAHGNAVFAAFPGKLFNIYDRAFHPVAADDPAATIVVMEHANVGAGGVLYPHIFTWYLPLADDFKLGKSYVNPHLHVGQYYPMGTFLGYQGNRRIENAKGHLVCCTYTHVHFQVQMDGTEISSDADSRDPSPFIGPNVNFDDPHHLSKGSRMDADLRQNGQLLVNAMFFNNHSDSGAFDVKPSTSPLFRRQYRGIHFNPSTNWQKATCTNKVGVNEASRPFTEIEPQFDGRCTTTIAHGDNRTAGIGHLTSFEAVFTANLSVFAAGSISFSVTADDGWILSMGPSNRGSEPTYVSGPLNNSPGSGPFTDYTVMGANNEASGPASFIVTVNFPAAGTYPLELDYTECCGGGLTLVFDDIGTPLP